MNKFISKIKQSIELMAVGFVSLPAILIALIAGFTNVFNFLNPYTQSPFVTGWLLVISWFVLSLSASVIVLIAKSKEKTGLGWQDGLYLKYGVWWDRRLNPYCPNCKKPMQRHNDRELTCSDYDCTTYIVLHEISGKEINIAEGLKILKQEIG